MAAPTSPRQQIKDWILNEHKHPQDIVAAMAGILRPASTKQYIKETYAEARAKGITLPPMQEPRTQAAQHPHKLGTRLISAEHTRIGVRINLHRRGLDMNAPTYSRTYGVGNQMSLRAMEVGSHDFTLSELQRIAAALGTDVISLLQPPGVNASH